MRSAALLHPSALACGTALIYHGSLRSPYLSFLLLGRVGDQAPQGGRIVQVDLLDAQQASGLFDLLFKPLQHRRNDVHELDVIVDRRPSAVGLRVPILGQPEQVIIGQGKRQLVMCHGWPFHESNKCL